MSMKGTKNLKGVMKAKQCLIENYNIAYNNQNSIQTNAEIGCDAPAAHTTRRYRPLRVSPGRKSSYIPDSWA